MELKFILEYQKRFCCVNFLQYSPKKSTETPVMVAASCSNNLDDSLLLKYAFIFAQALKSASYFEDSLKLLEIENKKYPIIAKRTIVMFFSRNLFMSNIVSRFCYDKLNF